MGEKKRFNFGKNFNWAQKIPFIWNHEKKFTNSSPINFLKKFKTLKKGRG